MNSSLLSTVSGCFKLTCKTPTCPTVTEFCVFEKHTALNPAKASWPDVIPAWLLKENADLLAPAVTDILNCSQSEARLPQSWKEADVAPIPKQTPVYDVNKHLRTISLTPVLSKLAEDVVVDHYVKPAVLANKVALARQFLRSSRQFATKKVRFH